MYNQNQNNYWQVPNYSYQMMPEVIPPKKKSKWWIAVIGIIMVILVVVGFLFFGKKSSKNKMEYDKLKETDSFFIENSNMRYALFHEDGTQLSDFIFKRIGTFYGGVTRVESHDGKSALIRDDGTYLIPFADDYIVDYQTLFLVKPANGGSFKIVNYKGEKIMEDSNLAIIPFEDPSLFLIAKEGSEDVTVVNYKGDTLDTLKKGNYSKSSKVSDGYVTLMDAYKTYLYNIDEGKKILELDGTYCVFKAKENTVILSSCSINDTVRDYRVIQKGKERYNVGKFVCSSLDIMEDGEVVCDSASADIYHFISNGTVHEDLVSGYHNAKTYALKKDTGLVFYIDGIERYRVDCATVDQMIRDGYLVRAYNQGNCAGTGTGYAYHSKTGEKLTDYFYKASGWDENGLAIVASDSENYYLLNDTMERVSEIYRVLYAANNLYVGMDKSGNYQLIDKKHQVLESGFRSFKNTNREGSKLNFVILFYDDKLIVYNSTDGTKVGENHFSNASLQEHYYTIGNTYYSYRTAKEFYTKQ